MIGVVDSLTSKKMKMEVWRKRGECLDILIKSNKEDGFVVYPMEFS